MTSPGDGAALHLLGVSCAHMGDVAGAERAWRIANDLAQPDAQAIATLTALADLLTATGRAREAADLLAPAVAPVAAALPLLSSAAKAEQALGRGEARLALRRRIAARSPGSHVARHNVAAAAGDVGDAALAEAEARAALAINARVPETWLVFGRALQALSRLDEAQDALARALDLRPGLADAMRDLAQLVWMRTGDADKALASISNRSVPEQSRVATTIALARIHDHLGRGREGHAMLCMLAGEEPQAAVAAGGIAMGFDPEQAYRHGRSAEAALGDDPAVARLLVHACYATGRGAEGLRRLAPLLAATPDDQSLVALQWTGWKLTGDARADALYDFERRVSATLIDVPPGWPDRGAYLADLADALGALHRFDMHPFEQSLRGGSQTGMDLLRETDPAIRAFPQAIDGTVRRHIAGLARHGLAEDFGAAGDYRFSGMWSVSLAPGGSHVGHVHPAGRISSACYVVLPEDVGIEDADDTALGGQQGWLAFGKPGFDTVPALVPGHAIRPEPGLLALFPSFMWHGTVPFAGPGRRVTIAFDVVPA